MLVSRTMGWGGGGVHATKGEGGMLREEGEEAMQRVGTEHRPTRPTPDVGLEPTTPRLRVSCSTD